jgi:putative oxidoreductase
MGEEWNRLPNKFHVEASGVYVMVKAVNRFYGTFLPGRAALGLLLLRLIFGIAFFLHGLPKLSHATGWMGPNAPVPGVLQAAAALTEVVGGLALAAGLLTPLAALFILIEMLVAIVTVHLKAGHPFVDPTAKGPSYELAAHYLVVALALLLAGPGTLSIDALLFGRTRDSRTRVDGQRR